MLNQKPSNRTGQKIICFLSFAILPFSTQPILAEEQNPSASEESAPDPETLLKKALSLLSDTSKPGNAQFAVMYLAQAAAAGNAEAANQLAKLYGKGEGVAENQTKAREWFEKAASAGLSKAKFNYGRFLILGIGGPVDVEKGIESLQASANEGIKPAQIVLAKIFFFGEYGQKIDYARAFTNAMLAAQAGDLECQNMVGILLSYGWGTKTNTKEGVFWLRKAVDRGHAKAQASYADALVDGSGIKRDHAEAIKYYTLAANQGEVTGKVPLENLTAVLDPAIVAEGTLRAEEFKVQAPEENVQK